MHTFHVIFTRKWLLSQLSRISLQIAFECDNKISLNIITIVSWSFNIRTNHYNRNDAIKWIDIANCFELMWYSRMKSCVVYSETLSFAIIVRYIRWIDVNWSNAPRVVNCPWCTPVNILIMTIIRVSVRLTWKYLTTLSMLHCPSKIWPKHYLTNNR